MINAQCPPPDVQTTTRIELTAEERRVLAGEHDGCVRVRPLHAILRRHGFVLTPDS